MGLPFVISRDVDLGLLQRCVCAFAIGATYAALEDDVAEVLDTAVECEKGDVGLVRCWTVYGPRGIVRVAARPPSAVASPARPSRGAWSTCKKQETSGCC